MLAARGARESDRGAEPIGDAAIEAALRRRARMVWAGTFVASAATFGALALLRMYWGL